MPSFSGAKEVYTTARNILKGRLETLLAGEQAGLSAEYSSLQENNVVQASDAAELSNNAGKNRYVNVLPFDYNRVKISGEDDYINASLVQVRHGLHFVVL